jgi:hypothetical protein
MELWSWTEPEDIEHWFYEIDLNLDEKREIIPKLNEHTLLSTNNSLHGWDIVYNVGGSIYRVYGVIGEWLVDENSLIVRLEPHERHSGR